MIDMETKERETGVDTKFRRPEGRTGRPGFRGPRRNPASSAVAEQARETTATAVMEVEVRAAPRAVETAPPQVARPSPGAAQIAPAWRPLNFGEFLLRSGWDANPSSMAYGLMPGQYTEAGRYDLEPQAVPQEFVVSAWEAAKERVRMALGVLGFMAVLAGIILLV